MFRPAVTSGTEPKARLLIEGREAAVLEHWSVQICAAIRNPIGDSSTHN